MCLKTSQAARAGTWSAGLRRWAASLSHPSGRPVCARRPRVPAPVSRVLLVLALLTAPTHADWMWQGTGPLTESSPAAALVAVAPLEIEEEPLTFPSPVPHWSGLEADTEPGALPAALMEAAARSEHLGQAVESYQGEKYADAGRTCKSFLRGQPVGAPGPLAQFLWAASEFRRGELDRSYDLFQDLERKFPASELGPHVARWELAIASRFLAGHKEKLFGLRIRDMRADAQVILERLLERHPYGQLTDRFLARLGDCYRAARDYPQAVLYYDRLLRDFPRSPLAQEAEFSRLECLILDCGGPRHDTTGLREAEEGLRAFVAAAPRGPRADMARQYIRSVRQLQAEQAFGVAEFYVLRQRWEAARVYFRLVRQRFPETRWSLRAGRRLEQLAPPPLVVVSEVPEP